MNDNSNNEIKDLKAQSEEEDYALIRAFNDGSDQAYSRLVFKHKDKVRNLVYLTLGDTEFIDDISQDVFISVFHKMKDFRFESKFTTWLYRITVNKCRDYLRKKKVRSIFVPIKNSEYNHSSSMRTDSIDIPALVRRTIEKLPEKLKEPLVLRDIDGFSYKEIAEKLGCEVGTVKSRIFRARESLKIILEPYRKELNL
ncbi:MAG: sigma-70 family RNA polymerase sigma factor [Chlorobi bacterium]|nr:sigma-70 family RNA polymerase sigma factor [Chlorobiota bacterium]